MDYIILTAIYLPLLGFLTNVWLLYKINDNTGIQEKYITLSCIVGVGTIATSFLIFLIASLLSKNQIFSIQGLHIHFFNWINVENFQINFAYLLDKLSIFMVFIITGIGSLIHLYAVEYMKDKKEETIRFFSYLNLFIFFMLNLVLADNVVLTFLGWEGVGLCSYLLIGFDMHKEQSASAGKKAFIVNRIGDAGFLLGIFMLYQNIGSLDYSIISAFFQNTTLPPISWDIIALVLFFGAMGKSAQIPLYVWLPDAMAGPTPVSALIHAATMVTAGIFMILRLLPVFQYSPHTSLFIAYIGVFTALFAALIAITQVDIKKVLAYSTVSQLGYMFLGIGVGAYSASMFHLMTHAFFKALLFLGAGSVIVALHHEQNMLMMGGLNKKLKFITVIFWIGAFAISGLPGFAGFFSKDMILEKAFTFQTHGLLLYSIGLVTAFLTSFYIFRLVFLVFYTGEPRSNYQVHDVGWHMKLSLGCLAVLSCVGGYVGIPYFILHEDSLIVKYFNQLVHQIPILKYGHHNILSLGQEAGLTLLSVSATILGFCGAYILYQKQKKVPSSSTTSRILVKASLNKFYVDEFYYQFIITPLKRIAHYSYHIIDVQWIDGMVDGMAKLILFLAKFLRRMQTNYISDYILYIILAVVSALVILHW